MPLAVITGATSPIGQAIGAALSGRGYDLILHRHRDHDLATQEGQEQFCEYVKTQTSVVDVLVHNAATFQQSDLESLTRQTWQKTMGLNAEAPLFLTQALLPLLLGPRNADAISPCVINLIDAMYDRPWKNYLAYASSKALLAHFTTSLALELAPRIRVNGVAPGAVVFPSDWDEQKKARITEKIPMQRVASLGEVARAVAYLVCDATYTTGEILFVDGGRQLVS